MPSRSGTNAASSIICFWTKKKLRFDVCHFCTNSHTYKSGTTFGQAEIQPTLFSVHSNSYHDIQNLDTIASKYPPSSNANIIQYSSLSLTVPHGPPFLYIVAMIWDHVQIQRLKLSPRGILSQSCGIWNTPVVRFSLNPTSSTPWSVSQIMT